MQVHKTKKIIQHCWQLWKQSWLGCREQQLPASARYLGRCTVVAQSCGYLDFAMGSTSSREDATHISAEEAAQKFNGGSALTRLPPPWGVPPRGTARVNGGLALTAPQVQGRTVRMWSTKVAHRVKTMRRLISSSRLYGHKS
jgi:hypothetical protein